MKNIKIILVLLFMTVSIANAQKLPKIQEGSVWAPDNIKIDGKLTEWKDQLQAYNPPNLISYSISNNGTYLYLTARMDGGVASRKTFRGGLTFTISSSITTDSALAITFPVIRPISQGDDVGLSLIHSPSTEQYNRLYKDTVANKTEIDSLISFSNNTIRKRYKDILVSGIKGTNEPIISIYNPEGIHVAGLFNRKMEYTYELAIPLKYLENHTNSQGALMYNIRVNAQPSVVVWPQIAKISLGDLYNYLTPENQYFNYTTDFSGEYTLAKKK